MGFRGLFAVAGLLLLGKARAGEVTVKDVAGTRLTPLKIAGKAGVLFFIASDCPISNSYAPKIQSICKEYGTKGVSCSLLYEDVALDSTAAKRHLTEYGYQMTIPAAIDSERKIANSVNATVTPEAVILDALGAVKYRGRIDDFYAGFGKTRREVSVHNVRDALDSILAGKPVAQPETKAWGCYIVSPEIMKRSK